MDSGSAALIGALGGSAVTAAFSLANGYLAGRRQRDIDQRADQRRLRDEKRARSRAAAMALLRAVATMVEILSEQQVIYEGDTRQERDARLNEVWRQSMSAANSAALELDLDVDAQDVLETYSVVRKAFVRHQNGLAANERNPGTVGIEQFERDRSELERGIEALRVLLRARLATFEAPI